ncbi:MAG: hypothetical protein QXI97_01860, partial [Nitrososphaerota archaeon]
MKYISIVLFIGFLFLISLETTTGARGVIWLEITGYISPGTAEHVEEHMRSARNYIAVLITIDTLGGQADAMIRIIEAIQSSPVPVIG